MIHNFPCWQLTLVSHDIPGGVVARRPLMLKRTQTIDRDGAHQHMLLGMSKMMPADYILA